MATNIYAMPPNITIGAQGATSSVGSQQTLTLSNLSNGIDIFNTFNLRNSQNVKKYEVIETTEDLLALSCTWYRIRQNKDNLTLQPHITNLLSEDLFRLVTPEDRSMADDVRDYYSKKFMVMALKDQHLTSFRSDLKNYLLGDAKKFTEKTIPMIYRMPEFYVNDIAFDEIKSDFEKTLPNFNKTTRRTVDLEVNLTPIKSFKKNSKVRGKVVEYWLKDSTNHAYRFVVKQDNALKGLWDIAFKGGSMQLNLNVQAGRRDELEFYNIGSILEG